MVSERTLELGSSLPLQLSPSLPAPSWPPASLHSLGHCPSCFSGSVWQICWKDISRKCAVNVWNGAVTRDRGVFSFTVRSVWAWAKCYFGRLTRAFRCECSSGGVPCVRNATLPVTQSGRCLSSPKPPHTFGFSKFL